jgi:cell division protein FtsB
MPWTTRTSKTHAPGRPSRRRLFLALAAPALLLTTGCLGARGNVELLEARLRQQQELAERAQQQLAQSQSELHTARQEADLLRTQLTVRGEQPLPAEFTQNLFQVTGLEFKGLLTGGRDRDGQPGDDVLVALVAPYDEHGDVVKLPGALELAALDMSRPEGEQQIARRKFAPDEARSLWKSGLLAAGYQCEVPWERPPQSQELLLHARLTTADGRQFDATHTIRVQTAAAGASPRELVPPVEARPVGVRPGDSPWDDVPVLIGERDSPIRPVGLESIVRPASGSEELLPPLLESVGEGEEAKPPESSAAPRPFPAGLRTSDVWTDETIPVVR